MLTIENVDVYGWDAAIRGMRNPMNSWDKSDSYEGCFEDNCESCVDWRDCHGINAETKLGNNDLALMKKLANAGDDHGKFLRMINVTLDIVAPLYWYKEFDTYKVGTVANSCSTMHKIHAKEFTMDDFSCEHLICDEVAHTNYLGVLDFVVDNLNRARERYITTKDKKHWWQMIQLLPSSYNQRRTVQLNYQVLRNIYHARRNHKLDEWHTFCDWIETLPYFKEVCLNEILHE